MNETVDVSELTRITKLVRVLSGIYISRANDCNKRLADSIRRIGLIFSGETPAAIENKKLKSYSQGTFFLYF